MRTTVIVLIALFVAATSHARLGETNVQICNRYGPVQKRVEDGTNEWHAGYLFKDYVIVVSYTNNVSQCELVSRTDRAHFSDEERDALMKNIGGAGNWKMAWTGADFQTWTNSASAALAREVKGTDGSDMLTVMTADFAVRDELARQKKEKAKADGF